MLKKITDVHEALNQAKLSTKDKTALVNSTFKILPEKKELAEQICAKNGITLSAFCRECVEGLIRDYCGEKAIEKLGE